MELTLSKNRPLNTVLTDADTGQAVYHVKTPFTFINNATTTISRVQSNDYADDEKDSGFGDHDVNDFAHIHWRHFGSDTLDYRGDEVLMKDYLVQYRKPLLFRSFTASDGQSYKWIVSVLGCVFHLETNDESKTIVARFHKSKLGVIGEKRKASLEISPAGLRVMDDIVVTFLYMRRLYEEVFLFYTGGGALLNFTTL